MSRPSRVAVSGPLARYARGFRVRLAEEGYSPHTAVGLLQLMAHLSRWLGERGLGVGDLTLDRADAFLRDRTAAGYVRRLSPRGLAPLLRYLDGLGLLPAGAESGAPAGIGLVLEEFVSYLTQERGLAAATVREYRGVAARFLTARFGGLDADRLVLGQLSAGDANGFLLGESVRLGTGSLNNVATGLRALLRFTEVNGLTAPGLADAVPRGPGWRRSSPRRVLDTDDVARLLAGCDRRTATGRRDHAILVLLVRLGLRAGEVAALRLEDVDWRCGEVLVTGKGGRCERLPVPVDVGRAIADYCRYGRPRCDERALFLQARAPYGPLSRDVVSEMVRRACGRAGLARVGAHRLRHAAAVAMRRGGAPLDEIGLVLRHRHQATTAVYATVAVDELRAVAREWPGGVA